MDEKDIEAYYDGFLESKMLKYRIYGNKRIDSAIERIKDFIKPGDNVLDVGCGIGIVSEAISEAVGPTGHVWAFDISETNIWYAKKTINKENISLFKANVVQDQKKIQDIIKSENIDVIVFVDVIEHIPIKHHIELFNFFKSFCDTQTYFILTYPSPHYQRYLMEENPNQLQIIDQIIEFDHIQLIEEATGLSIKHYSLENVWMQNQYVHCVLQVDNSLNKLEIEKKASLIRRVKRRIQNYIKYPYKKYKYVNSVFNEDYKTR